MKIDKSIPLPPRNADRGNVVYAEWREMEVGDSVLVGSPGDKAAKHSPKMQYARKVTGFTFESRSVPEGVRFWRTA